MSSHGRVWNTKLGRELKPRDGSGYGYQRVVLRREGRSFEHYVHHLVARHFLTGYREGAQIEHHDRNNSNNHVENLRFMGPKGVGQLVRNLIPPRYRKVLIVESGHVFRTVEDCARYLGGDPSSVYRVLRGERLTHKGYTFQYIEDNYDG